MLTVERAGPGDAEGGAVAICMLSLGQGRHRIAELLELTGKYIAAGAEVYWVSFDALAYRAGFELPPGVYWLRLCEPALSSGGLREAIALAAKLAPVLNYLEPVATVPFQRAARRVVRLAQLAVRTSFSAAVSCGGPPASVMPRWLETLLLLVSPQRNARLRKEAMATAQAIDTIFNSEWYGEQYGVPGGCCDCKKHYLHVGQYLGYNPHAAFWASWYSERYLRVASAVPLAHYFQFGAEQDLDPNPFFCTKWYKEQAGLPPGSGKNPLAHYLYDPGGAAIDPSPLFDTHWYRKARPGLGERTPLEDFICTENPPSPSPVFEKAPFLRQDGTGKELSYATLFSTAFAMRLPAQAIHHIEARPVRPTRRFAICSVITGHYEPPYPVSYSDAEVDYYLLTDQEITRPPKPWKTVHVPMPAGSDPIKHSRYLKMHLNELVPNVSEYEVIGYADGNLQFVGSLASLFYDFVDSPGTIALIRHPQRCCAYREAAAILLLLKDEPANGMRVLEFLLKEGFPPNAGLFEMNYFMFKPSVETHKLLKEWWRLFQLYGNRDQPLLPYALSRRPLSIYQLFPEGVTVRNVDSIIYHPHGAKA
jgi:hypothetical protein